MKKKIIEKLDYFLEKYSKILKLDLNYLFKGGFWLSIGHFFTMVRSFILSIIFANFLTKSVYGEYSLIMLLLGIAGIFALSGMQPAIIHSVARKFDGTYFKAQKIILKFSLIGSVFLLCVSGYDFLFGGQNQTLIFILLALLFPFYSVSNNYSTFLNGKKMFKTFVKFSTIFNAISMVGIIAAVFFFAEAYWIVLISVTINIIVNGYFAYFVPKKLKENDLVDESDIEFGKKTSIAKAFVTIGAKADGIIISFLLGFEALAIFTIVTMLPNQIKTLSKAYTPLILPKLSEKKVILEESVNRNLKRIFLLSFGLIVAYSIIAPVIFFVFYPNYFDYFWLSIIFHLSFISFPSIFLESILVKKKKSSLIIKKDLYGVIILLISSSVLIWFFGLLGAIFARIIYRMANLVMLYIYYYLYCRES